MAGFVYFAKRGVSEPLPDISVAEKQVAPEGFEGIRGECSAEAGRLAWQHGRTTPFERFDGEEGTALLWGDAVAYESDDYLTAEAVYRKIAAQQADEGERVLSRYSGLYAWVFLAKSGALVAGVDPFGIYPVYYFQEGNDFGLATSLAALRAHPAYCSAIDPVGLMRYVIQNGSTGVRTIEQSGCRLEICCSIQYDPGSNSVSLNQHPLPGPHPGEKVQDEREAIMQSVEATRSAVRRHIARAPDHALLSGGLDSRHVLALAYEFGVRPVCCTAGRSSDYEAIFAALVAKRLGLEWRCGDDSVETLQEDIDTELRLQSLGGGFSIVTLNGGAALTRRTGTRYLGGLVLDVHYAPYYSVDNTSRHPMDSYEHAFHSWINRFGVEFDFLKELCTSPEMREALEVACAEIRTEWEAIEGTANDRVWWTIMRFRGRSHLGGHAWKESFHAWPVLPGLDLPMVESIRSIGDEHYPERKLQRESLRTIHPDLARIPLATLSHSPKPIIPNLGATLLRKRLRLRAKLMGRQKRLQLHRYVRSMSVESEAWHQVRSLAEPYRESLHEFFDSALLERYAPKPGVAIGGKGARIRRDGGRRFLYGLMRWNGMR